MNILERFFQVFTSRKTRYILLLLTATALFSSSNWCLSASYGQIVYARKNIKAGSLFYASDIGCKQLELGKIPGKSCYSPFELIGSRACKNIMKNQIIASHQVDYLPQLSPTEKLVVRTQARIAAAKWSSFKDLYSWNNRKMKFVRRSRRKVNF